MRIGLGWKKGPNNNEIYGQNHRVMLKSIQGHSRQKLNF